MDAKILETESELSELLKTLEKLNKEGYNMKDPNLEGSNAPKLLNNVKAISDDQKMKNNTQCSDVTSS